MRELMIVVTMKIVALSALYFFFFSASHREVIDTLQAASTLVSSPLPGTDH